MKTLFCGGNIITMAEPLYAEAVLVENEKIVSVGKESELRKSADACVDLKGATMLPGFIDAHSHLTEYAAAFLEVSLDGVSDFEEIKRRIQAHILKNNVPKGEWVVARNYEHHLFPNSRKLTLDELDEIAPDHLLLLKHTSCHMGLVNSRVFEKFGITDDVVQPKNGRYVIENGKLTGCLEEGACSTMREKVPPQSVDNVCKAHVEMQKHYASYGITTAQDGFLGRRMPEIYKKLYDSGNLTLDLISYAPKASYLTLSELMKSLPEGINARLGGAKYFLDGSPQIRTAWIRDEYIGGGNGAPCHTDEEVIEAFRFAAEQNIQIIIHSNGDAAIEQFLRCLEIVSKEFPNSKKLRHTIIHAQLMGTDQLDRARALGVIVSFFVAHTYHFADTHIKNLGLERAIKISPTRSALEKGVVFTFHQDAPVIEPNMLESVWCAANRITKNGVHLAGEEITVLEALRAVTVNAAYQYFEEDRKGSMEVGKLADFVILDKNPLKIAKEYVKDVAVLSTYKNGKKIFEKEYK